VINDVSTWLGGGVVLVLLYIVISNTLWLLFGSRLVQCLPGVNINGFRGTVKIAAMLALSFVGVVYWMIKYVLALVIKNNPKPLLKEEISKAIKKGARMMNNIKES